jgi:hypothetical protein
MVENKRNKVEFLTNFIFNEGRKMQTNKISWKQAVESIFLEHKGKWNAPQIYNDLQNHNVVMIPTCLNTIQKHINKNRTIWLKRIEDMDKEVLDIPWTMANIKEKGIPAEVIPYITKVQAWAKLQAPQIDKQINVTTYFLPINLRQTTWIARLYILAGDWQQLKEKDISWLWRWSRAYELSEIAYKLSGQDKQDTTLLDSALMDAGEVYIKDKMYFIYPKHGNPFWGTADSNVYQ